MAKNLAEEHDRFRSDLDGTRRDLVNLQGEALKSYEEGYRDCWGRFASGVDVDPARNTFEEFLSELRAKASRDEAGSSNRAPENDA